MQVLAADRVRNGQETAAINRTQSKRFALAGPHRTSRQRLDCVCLSTALRLTAMMPPFEAGAIPISEFGVNTPSGWKKSSTTRRRRWANRGILKWFRCPGAVDAEKWNCRRSRSVPSGFQECLRLRTKNRMPPPSKMTAADDGSLPQQAEILLVVKHRTYNNKLSSGNRGPIRDRRP